MNNQILTEIKNEINSLITEELTINDSVKNCTEEIENYILDNIEQGEIVKTYNGGAVRTLNFKHLLFTEDGNELPCNVSVENHNFVNNTYFRTYNKNNTIDLNCGSVYRRIGNKTICILIIKYISIGFKPFSKFYQDVPHEINHIFQQYKDGQAYQNVDKYGLVKTYLYSEDERLRNVSELLYNLEKSEQDSFVTSVYNYVKHEYFKGEQEINTILQNTEAFENIVKIKRLFADIVNNKETYYDVVVNTYGFKTWNIFVRRCRNLIKRYEKKFAMVSIKCKRDFVLYETHTFYSGMYDKFLLF